MQKKREINIKYIQIFHDNNAAFMHKPETEGTITFISNDVEGKKKFKGSSIMEIISQMAEFIDTLKQTIDYDKRRTN